MVLCVSREAGLNTKAQKCEVHWVGTDWIRAPFKCCETAQSLHANIPLTWTYIKCLTASPSLLHFNRTRVENMKCEEDLPSCKEAQM